MESFVTIKIFTNMQALHMAKSYLASQGIDSFEVNELVAQVLPHLNNVNGGAQLKVHPDEVARAVELLIEGGFAAREDFEASPELKSVERLLDKIRALLKGKS